MLNDAVAFILTILDGLFQLFLLDHVRHTHTHARMHYAHMYIHLFAGNQLAASRDKEVRKLSTARGSSAVNRMLIHMSLGTSESALL